MRNLLTFAIEGTEVGDQILYRLCVEDGKVSTPIAVFLNQESMAVFTRALDLAKEAAYAHGRSGI